MRRGTDERGQTTVLIVGLAVVAALMVAAVVDASAAYLRRQGLDSLADGAALAATDAIQGRQVYEGGLGEHAQLDPETARGYVASYLRSVQADARYPGLGYAVDTRRDRVVVRLRAPLVLPLTPPGWERRPVIGAVAASVVDISD